MLTQLSRKRWEHITAIVDKNQKRLKARAFAILHDEMDAEDIVQELVLLLYERYMNFNFSDSRKTAALLAYMTKYKSIDLLRKKARSISVDMQDSQNEALLGLSEADVEAESKFFELMSLLKKEDAQILTDKIYYESTYEEIAVAYGLRETACRKRVQRALNRLEKKMKGQGLI